MQVDEQLLINTATAAQMLAISERSLWTLANEGQIPRVLIGRSVRFDPSDLRAWVARTKSVKSPSSVDAVATA